MAFHKTTDATKDPGRVAIARHLEANGPTAGDELALALRLTPDRFWTLINHSWFGITGKGWGLTERGRAEALA